MRIAVTGAGGHLGQHVVGLLLKRGHDLLCISRHPLDNPTIAGVDWQGEVTTMSCDLADRAMVEAGRPMFHEVEGVVHLAAHVPASTSENSEDDAEGLLKTNVLGTLHLLDALRGSSKLESFIYSSSFEVYSPPCTELMDEEHPTTPLTYYGASKLAGEKYLALMSADSGVSCCSLRMPAVYGPGDNLDRAVGNFVRSAVAGKPVRIFGDGTDRRDMVYAADAAEAIAICLEQQAEGVFNLGSGIGYTVREIAEEVIRATGDIVSLEQGPRVKPKYDYVMDIERARSQIGWQPATSLEDGIRAQLDWWRQAGTPG